jgi:hypothetical protein
MGSSSWRHKSLRGIRVGGAFRSIGSTCTVRTVYGSDTSNWSGPLRFGIGGDPSGGPAGYVGPVWVPGCMRSPPLGVGAGSLLPGGDGAEGGGGGLRGAGGIHCVGCGSGGSAMVSHLVGVRYDEESGAWARRSQTPGRCEINRRPRPRGRGDPEELLQPCREVDARALDPRDEARHVLLADTDRSTDRRLRSRSRDVRERHSTRRSPTPRAIAIRGGECRPLGHASAPGRPT